MPEKLKYSEDNIDMIRTGISNLIKTNPESFYSVKVNGVMVVPKTKDISLFDSFLDHVNENTQNVVFTKYYQSSKGGDTITLLIGEVIEQDHPVKKETGLNGAEKEELRRQVRYEMENQYLKEENERLKKENEKLEKYTQEVDVLIGQLRIQRMQTKDKSEWKMLGDIVANFSRINPDIFKQNPTLEMLAGMLPVSEQKNPTENLSGTESSVQITPKNQPAEILDQRTKDELLTIKELHCHFSDIEYKNCIVILALIKDHKELIPVTYHWLKELIEEKRTRLHEQKKQTETSVEVKKETPAEMKKEVPEEKTKEEPKVFPEFEDEPEIYHP